MTDKVRTVIERNGEIIADCDHNGQRGVVMKKCVVLFLFFALICLASPPSYALTHTFRGISGASSPGDTHLDGIVTNNLSNGEVAIGLDGLGNFCSYEYDTNNTDGEDTTNNTVIYPEYTDVIGGTAYTGTGAWILQSVMAESVQSAPSGSPSVTLTDSDSPDASQLIGGLYGEYLEGAAGSVDSNVYISAMLNGIAKPLWSTSGGDDFLGMSATGTLLVDAHEDAMYNIQDLYVGDSMRFYDVSEVQGGADHYASLSINLLETGADEVPSEMTCSFSPLTGASNSSYLTTSWWTIYGDRTTSGTSELKSFLNLEPSVYGLDQNRARYNIKAWGTITGTNDSKTFQIEVDGSTVVSVTVTNTGTPVDFTLDVWLRSGGTVTNASRYSITVLLDGEEPIIESGDFTAPDLTGDDADLDLGVTCAHADDSVEIIDATLSYLGGAS